MCGNNMDAESFEAPKGKKDFEYFSNKKENANGIRLMIPFRKETEWYGDDKYIIKNEIIDKYTFKDTDIRYDRDYFRNKECNVVEFITFDETDKKIVDDVIDELKSKGFKVSKSKYFYHWLDVYGAESFGAEYEPPKMKDGDLIDFGDGHGYIKIGSHGRYNRDGSMISPVKSMHCGSNGIYVLIGNITGQSTFVLISQDKEKLKQKYREYSNFDEWHDFETKKDADSWWKSNRLEDILEKGYSSLHVVLLKEVIEAMHDPNRINVGTTEKDGKYADGTPRFKRFNAENWGGDPEGPLAKALEKARKKSKKSKKPLKIEKLDAEQFGADGVIKLRIPNEHTHEINDNEWMGLQIDMLIQRGIVEYCEECDWIFPKDTDHALYQSGHLMKEGEADEMPCYFCGKEAQTEKGVLYYRTQLPGGKWGSVEICLPCLEHINKVKEGKWIKRTDPNNPQRFYYSKGDRLDYDAKTKKHGAYIRSGGGDWNEQQNAKGMGYDNGLGKLVKLPNHLTKDFLSNSKTPHKKGITSKRGMGFVLGGIALVLVVQQGLKK
tara:strand:+ start:25 stop:1674 length:1650 start_codon:yes stop_codon:yes gene_type:complete